MKNKINELKAGVVISYITLVASTIIPLLYTPVMLRIMGQEEYGLYSLANSIIGYLSLLNFGMGNAAVRYLTKCRAENDKVGVERTVGLFLQIYSVLAILVLAGGIGLIFGSKYLFAKGLTDSELSRLKILLVLMTFSTVINFISSVFGAVIVSYEKFFFRKILDMVVTVATPIMNLIVLFMGYASVGMTVVTTILQIMYGCIFFWYCIKKLDIIPKVKNPPKELIKEIIGFSIFIFIGSIVDTLYWATDKVLIGAMIGTSAVAVYNVGGTFTAMLQTLATTISGVFTPRVTTMVVQKNNPTELSNLLIQVGRIQYLIVSLVLSGFIVYGRSFLKYWAGDGYTEAYPIALLTMIPLAIPLIQSIAFSTIIAQNKHQFRAILYLIIAIINVISTIIVIPQYGIIGAALCTSIAFILGTGIIINIYYYKVTHLDIPLFWKNIIKMSIVPTVLSSIVILYHKFIFQTSNIIQLLIEIIGYSIVFCVLSWFLSMNQYEKNIFKTPIKRLVKKLRSR